MRVFLFRAPDPLIWSVGFVIFLVCQDGCRRIDAAFSFPLGSKMLAGYAVVHCCVCLSSRLLDVISHFNTS
jgi:hypothetical protein